MLPLLFLAYRPFITDCQLEGVGKPVFHAHANTYYGAWMRDAYPRTGPVIRYFGYTL